MEATATNDNKNIVESNTASSLDPNLSEDQKAVLSSVNIPNKLDIKITNADSVSSETVQMNEAFELSRKLYQDVLSPQLEKNEELKREQKKELMSKIFKILKWQFIFTYFFVAIILLGSLLSGNLKISENIILNIISFVKFYITSIIVELLSILFFIVKNVFDKSIVDLIKNFDKRSSK